MRTLVALTTTTLLALVVVACVAPVEDPNAPDQELAGELEQSVQALRDCEYDKAKADKLGQTARSGSGAHSKSRCYAYVKQHLRKAGFTLPAELSGTTYGASAADFTKFANAQPAKLAEMGLVPVSVPAGEAVPQGVILNWPRGMCGYSKKHGHIEIVCNEAGTEACSDFRGRNRRSATCNPNLFAPKGTCQQADSCAEKEDGFYCSALDARAAFECRNMTVIGATYCSTGKQCGIVNAKANISAGALQCQ